VGNFEQALEEAGVRPKPLVAPAICFLDLSGYTRLTEERGDADAAKLAADVAHAVDRTSRQHGGKVVKWLGDGVMLYFRDSRPVVPAALSMLETVVGAGLLRAHVGVDAGPVVFQEGDYFGRTVNIAARITDYARPGEVLVSEAAKSLSQDAQVAFAEVGPVDLKGIKEPIRVYTAHRG
jgi:class 3 adenylate cyclase